MDSIFIARGAADAVPIWFVTAANYADVRKTLGTENSAFAAAAGFEPKAGRFLLLPGQNGKSALAGVLFGLEGPEETQDPFLPGRLAQLLPDGTYRFANEPRAARLAALSIALGLYRFTRYRKAEARAIKLDLPQSLDRDDLARIVEAVTLARDLINTPANDMGPAQLEQAARKLAARHSATINAIVGDDLLEQNFPLIHAVGRAAAGAPRLIDMAWGDTAHPKVTLVGKGVCYDTGGLDIKPSSAMALMKKDMGGAAVALALAEMLLSVDLPLRLRVILPIVENSVSAASFRTGDVYKSRKGLTVEIGNTDAEGRLILADALALAAEDEPDLLFDLATLTGAARVALGPEIPPFYTRSDALAEEITRAGASSNDPVWRLPLWEAYQSGLDSKIADVSSTTIHSFAGSITAALFLSRFVAHPERWAHFDVYCWNPSVKPGRPEGGDIQAARLLYDLIEARVAAGSGMR